MSYFSKFSKGTFRVGDKLIEAVNIAQYSELFEKLSDEISFYSYYTVVNGDRLDVISKKLYGTTEYYWTIALLNKHIVNTYRDLPKEYNAELIEYLKGVYPGYALKLATGQSLAGKFEIGETVSYLTYTGIITGKYPTLGYLTIDLTSEDSFPMNQEFTLTGETSNDTISIANTMEYYMAPHHYEDADDQWVKWNSGQTTVISILEYESSENDSKSQLKVIRPDVIYNVVTEFERQMRRA
jgi:hypothetical protein